MTSEKQELKNKGKGISGLVFVGCLMLGLAFSFITGNFVVGVLGGLGIGFIAMAIAMAVGKQDSMRKGISGLVFVGCLMVGLAIGFLVGNIVVGLFGGLGAGFIAMFIAYNSTGEW
ncbi:MAG: hypothetical protein KDE48_18835 [Anaerolineales bacterium]|nr:hypothetical protein [Anaerolineales bacterium]